MGKYPAKRQIGMLSGAPVTLRIMLLVMLCAACMTGLTGALGGNRILLLIAAGLVAVSTLIILVWRSARKPERDVEAE